MIHVAIATKAEYIKTAPVLRELTRRGVAYRIVDIGQHGGLPPSFREPLEVDDPTVRLGSGRDAETIPAVVRWAVGVARRLLWSRRRVRRDLFGGLDGPCLVHGDTPSTMFATLLARRAGLDVLHLESGLRSFHLLQPFPEELCRIVVMRRAAVLYAPNDDAAANLAAMKVKGTVVPTPGNTAIDAVRHAVDAVGAGGEAGPGIIAVHRVENLHKRERVDGFIELLRRAAATGPTRFLVHPPTERALKSNDRWGEVLDAGPTIEPLLTHGEFMQACATARWVITDGGSIQEECAVLGVPTLLWRSRTERPDGLGASVVMSEYDVSIVDEFLADPERLRRPPLDTGVSPAVAVVDDVLSRYA